MSSATSSKPKNQEALAGGRELPWGLSTSMTAWMTPPFMIVPCASEKIRSVQRHPPPGLARRLFSSAARGQNVVGYAHGAMTELKKII